MPRERSSKEPSPPVIRRIPSTTRSRPTSSLRATATEAFAGQALNDAYFALDHIIHATDIHVTNTFPAAPMARGARRSRSVAHLVGRRVGAGRRGRVEAVARRNAGAALVERRSGSPATAVGGVAPVAPAPLWE